MDDTISRQVAIEALNKLDVSDGVGISSIACGVQESAIIAIQHLPSAQPEQTCEYWDSESKFCSLCRPSAQPEHEYTMEEFMYGQDMGNPEDGSL